MFGPLPGPERPPTGMHYSSEVNCSCCWKFSDGMANTSVCGLSQNSLKTNNGGHLKTFIVVCMSPYTLSPSLKGFPRHSPWLKVSEYVWSPLLIEQHAGFLHHATYLWNETECSLEHRPGRLYTILSVSREKGEGGGFLIASSCLCFKAMAPIVTAGTA